MSTGRVALKSARRSFGQVLGHNTHGGLAEKFPAAAEKLCVRQAQTHRFGSRTWTQPRASHAIHMSMALLISPWVGPYEKALQLPTELTCRAHVVQLPTGSFGGTNEDTMGQLMSA